MRKGGSPRWAPDGKDFTYAAPSQIMVQYIDAAVPTELGRLQSFLISTSRSFRPMVREVARLWRHYVAADDHKFSATGQTLQPFLIIPERVTLRTCGLLQGFPPRLTDAHFSPPYARAWLLRRLSPGKMLERNPVGIFAFGMITVIWLPSPVIHPRSA
jgi:hypothetical protein